MDEAALIQKARRGDSVALARLLQLHYLTVKKYLISICFDRSLAEDLTQESMIRAIQRIGQFREQSKFTTWLCAIATNLYMDWLRKQTREQRLEAEAYQQALLNQVDLSEEVRALLGQVAELPREVALPVILKHYHGYTYEEIADWMELPVGTVKSRIFNGIQRLRKERAADEG